MAEDILDSVKDTIHKVVKKITDIPEPLSPTSRFLEKLGLEKVEVTINLNPEQMKSIEDTFRDTADKIADRVDYRWKVTQYLIAIGYIGTAFVVFFSK
mgnify:CR=1 FL=1